MIGLNIIVVGNMKCFRCNEKLVKEKIIKQYPLYCPNCNENMFVFEGIEEFNGESKNILRWYNESKRNG